MKHREAADILKQVKKGKPILVEWVDAQMSSDQWVETKDVAVNDVCSAETVGMFFDLGKEQVWVVQTSIRKQEHHAYPFAIPLGCVKRIRVLR